MTSHSYYKDRLGFDPNEVNYEMSTSSSTIKRKASSSSSSHHHQHHQQAAHHQQHRQIHNYHQSSPQSTYTRISVPPTHIAGNSHYTQHDELSSSSTSNINHAKKAKSTTPSGTTSASAAASAGQSQGGYEDALSQFKGIKSMWEFFILNWEVMRKKNNKFS